jgi:glutamate-1-semialdehyde 2,1-aminomutase
VAMNLIYWTAGLGLAVLIIRRVRLRLQLSLAKHRSLAGHPRIARLVARLLPYYEYDDARFFRADDAPPATEAQRRAAFQRLASLFAQRFALTLGESRKVQAAISDLQFTSRYRVPFQFSSRVRQQLSCGSFVSASSGRTVTDLDGNRR